MAFTTGIGGLMGAGPHEIAALAAGSAFPDMMDSFLAGGSRDVWKGVHRTVSHWPVLYPVTLIFLAFCGINIPENVFRWVCAFILGALVHVSCDFMTPMGVPLYPPFTRRASLKLIRTGSISDYAVGFFPVIIYGLVTAQQSF